MRYLVAIAVGAAVAICAWVVLTILFFGLANLRLDLAALALLGVFGLIAVVIVTTGKKHRDRETRCRKCGYILRGISEPRCPECGERI